MTIVSTYTQEIYTNFLMKVVLVKFAPAIYQIEFHFLIEEYFDFIIGELQKYYQNNYIIFTPKETDYYNESEIWNKRFLIKAIHNEKASENSLFLGDSWLNLALDVVAVDEPYKKAENFYEALNRQLNKFDEIFNYQKNEIFQIDANEFENNIIFNYPIKRIQTISSDVIEFNNKKIKSIVIKENETI